MMMIMIVMSKKNGEGKGKKRGSSQKGMEALQIPPWTDA